MSEPGGQKAGSDTKVWLTKEANCQSFLHSFIALMGVVSDHRSSWDGSHEEPSLWTSL